MADPDELEKQRGYRETKKGAQTGTVFVGAPPRARRARRAGRLATAPPPAASRWPTRTPARRELIRRTTARTTLGATAGGQPALVTCWASALKPDWAEVGPPLEETVASFKWVG